MTNSKLTKLIKDANLEIVAEGKDGILCKRKGTDKFIGILKEDYDGDPWKAFVNLKIHPFVFSGSSFIDLLSGDEVNIP